MNTKDPWATRESLLQKIEKKGDEEAWQEFSDYYLSFVGMVLKKMDIPDDISSDITQEVLLRIWKAFQSERGVQREGKFRSWLSLVILKKAKIYLERQKRRISTKRIEDQNTLQIQEQDEVESYVNLEWKSFLTNKALESAKKHFRGKTYEVFLLDLEGKTPEEICELLSLSIHAVYTYRARFKKQLVKEIKKLQDQYEGT